MLYGTDYIQVVHGEGIIIGELAPSGSGTFVQGTLMERCDPEACIPGNGMAVGMLLQQCDDTGPTFENMTIAPNSNLPVLKGSKVGLLDLTDGMMIEVENEAAIAYNAATNGPMVTSSTGAITASTALNTPLSCKNGRWYVAQSGDRCLGLYKGNLTPWVTNTVANIRCAIQIKPGAVV